MIIDEALDLITGTIKSTKTGSAVRAFLFGSTLRSKTGWSDIDIAFVCDDIADRIAVRTSLSKYCGDFPIDIIVMSIEEEAELQFLETVGAKLIAATDHTPGRAWAP